MSNKPDIDSLFEEAIRIDSPEARAEFVRDACGDHDELRRELQQLLQSDGVEDSFLENPPAGLEETRTSDASGNQLAASMEAGLATAFSTRDAVVIGDANHSVLKMLGNTLDEVPRVSLREPRAEGEDPISRPGSPEISQSDSDSRYRLDGEIARGGMGAVLKGRDMDLGRDLAIKVLLNSHRDNPQVIQRFIEEAQIGGQLQHPGIAPVYELGQFADQRPFFSMKLVKGDTLAKLLGDREDAAAERGKLIGIFAQICQTMAYAHSRGVIHRDLKPANIMVGAFGEVQVMDWGLAKVLQSGGAADEKKAKETQQGQSIIQTMRSAGSDVPGSFGSTGSDTQMGSVMGTPAYMPPEQALGEIDRMDQRADVFGLGAILCEIVTGQPPYVGEDGTQVYRMASRGKLDDAFGRLDGCAADPELITLAKHCLELEPANRPKDASVLAERITAYLESVEQKLRDTELAKVEAQVRAEELRRRQKLAYTTGTAIVATLLIGISASLWQMFRANTAEKLAREETIRATAAEQKTANTLVQVAAERDAKELALKDAEQISTFLSDVMKSPDPTRDGREIKVAELLDNAAKKLETDLADQPRRRAILQAAVGGSYLGLGLYPQAISLQETVRQHFLRTSGLEHPDTLGAMNDLAHSYTYAGRRDEALQLREEVLALSRRELGPEAPATLKAMTNLATSYSDAGRRVEALKLVEEVLPLKVKVLGPEHPDTLIALGIQATSYLEAGRWDEALPLTEEVLTLNRKILGPEDPRTLGAMNNLAIAYNLTGHHGHHGEHGDHSDHSHHSDHGEPLQLLNKVLRLRQEILTLSRKVNGPEHSFTLVAMNNLATSYHGAGRLDEALSLTEDLLLLRRKVLGLEHPDTLVTMNNLAASYSAASRRDEALKLQEEVLPLNRKILGPEHRLTLASMTNLANSYREAGRLNEAVTLQEQSLAIKRRVLPANDPFLEIAINGAARLYWMTDRPDEALRLFEELLVRRPDNAGLYNNFAWYLVTIPNAKGEYPNSQQAVEWARRANELVPNNGGLLNTLGVALYRAEEWQKTIDVLQQSIELGIDVPHNSLFIAMAHWQLDQKDQVKEWYDKSLAWKTANEADFKADAEVQGFFAEAAKLMAADAEDFNTTSAAEPADADEDKANETP